MQITHEALICTELHRSPHSRTVDRTPSMPQYHLAELARKGWYANPVEAPGSHLINSWHTSPGGAGTQNRPKPRMSAKIRYGTAYHSSNKLNVLPWMRRLFVLGAGRTPPCCLKCVCCLTSSNVGNRRPGVCIASTMQFFMHTHSPFGFGS